ncbi:MAG: S-methyl-5-thioribose-1-phosphate isomerase [Bacteriovoracaceae bacterium]|jgi:methylthioribose-1-phosphate isomerase|nr:S-methyl-5-thioribose-1-phosphate isomerase [Bacteriovoracaceae bacterium]
MNFSPLNFENDTLFILDQTLLPNEEVFVECKTIKDVYDSIEVMHVRGAPCIGFAALFGLALWIKDNTFNIEDFKNACLYIKEARPTAVNLAYEVDTLLNIIQKSSIEDHYSFIVKYAYDQIELLKNNNLAMAISASERLSGIYSNDKKLNILTHCNTGFLACGCIGTALGVIEYLHSKKRINKVWVDETRPYLQGSRLTAFELEKLGVDYEIVVDSCSSHLMKNGFVDAIFVGADRIASNGDTANKVGTSTLSIVANYYKVPFYVVAPKSSFDINIKSGDEIKIELRSKEEITKIKGTQIAPLNALGFNPSFDITDSSLIDGIICEEGLFEKPYKFKDII